MKIKILLVAIGLLLGACAPNAGTIVKVRDQATGCATYVQKDDMWLNCQKVGSQNAVVTDHPEIGHELGGKVRLELVGGKVLWFMPEDYSVPDTSPS